MMTVATRVLGSTWISSFTDALSPGVLQVEVHLPPHGPSRRLVLKTCPASSIRNATASKRERRNGTILFIAESSCLWGGLGCFLTTTQIFLHINYSINKYSCQFYS